MTDGERERVLAAAREQVAAGRELEHSLAARLMRVPLPDALTQWRAKAAEREAGRQRARAELRRSEQQMVNTFNTATAAGTSAAELNRILGEVFVIERRKLGETLRAEQMVELSDLKNQVAELRGQVGVLLNLLSGSKADVVTLPARRARP